MRSRTTVTLRVLFSCSIRMRSKKKGPELFFDCGYAATSSFSRAKRGRDYH
ncbi:hypothetical protein HYS47_04835 [Candidatus Woesearchaeota archaeon]|nr:hypothetical protein [Candidatus Woesearchaeota archaeon]